MIMNYKTGVMWAEAVIVLPRNLPGGTQKNTRKSSD